MDIKEQVKDHEIRLLDLEKSPIDLLEILRGGGVKIRFSKRHVALWMTSLIISIFRDTAIILIERIKIFLEGDVIMGIFDMIRPDFGVIILFMISIGYILKTYVPSLTNRYIPLVLIGISFISCAVWGYASSQFIGKPQIIDAILYCGLFQGVPIALFASGGWDAFHGVTKKEESK